MVGITPVQESASIRRIRKSMERNGDLQTAGHAELRESLNFAPRRQLHSLERAFSIWLLVASLMV